MIACDKLAERALTALLLLPVAWVACVALSFAWDGMALERFYRDRPILQAMRMAHDDAPTVEFGCGRGGVAAAQKIVWGFERFRLQPRAAFASDSSDQQFYYQCGRAGEAEF